MDWLHIKVLLIAVLSLAFVLIFAYHQEREKYDETYTTSSSWEIQICLSLVASRDQSLRSTLLVLTHNEREY